MTHTFIHSRILTITLAVLTCLASLSQPLSAAPSDTAFTYQGRLTDGGSAANGNYDLRFAIYDSLASGNSVGGTVTNSATGVTNGLFTVTLDFGAGVFSGSDRWLEIAVRTNGGGTFIALEPRQSITATPYALYSPSAGTAVSVSGAVPAAQVSGVLPTAALPANVALRDANQTFSGGNLFSGSLGIGTPNTIQVLTVGQAETPLNSGSQVGVYDAGQAFIVARQTTANIEATFGVDSAAGVVSVLTDHPLVFRAGNGAGAGNVEYLRIARGGNVGIRTFTPATALEVNGTVTASGFSGNGAVSWQTVAGTSQQAQPNHGYLLANDALVTLTLPASPNPGDVVRVSGTGAGGWRISQNVGQSVLVKNIPGNIGSVWMPRGPTGGWWSVASSADGSKLVAVEYGEIHTSTDSGVNWTPRAINRLWLSVASSADGNKLVAGAVNSQIYTSTDSGVSWTPRESIRNWRSVASSADGSKLVAVENNGGLIYTSTDSGVNWTLRESNRSWLSVASSVDGSKLVAGVSGGQIYTSSAPSTPGTSGYLLGDQGSAIELQYVGNGQFLPLSFAGNILAY